MRFLVTLVVVVLLAGAIALGGVVALAALSVDRIGLPDLDPGTPTILALVGEERVVLSRYEDGHVDAVVLPVDLVVTVSGVGHATLATAYTEGGAVRLMEAVRAYTNVPIGHYLEVDPSRLRDVALERETLVACARPARHEEDETARGIAATVAALRGLAAPTTALNPIRLVRDVHAVGGAVAVSSTTRTGDLLRLPWAVGDLETLSVVRVPTQDSPDGRRALPEQAETLFQALRLGDPLPPAVTGLAVEVDVTEMSVTVLNGSGVSRLASRAADALRERGVDVVEVGNAPRSDYETTEVRHSAETKIAAEALAEMFTGTLVETDENGLVVVIGHDWAERPVLRDLEPVADATTLSVRIAEACG